MVEFLHSDTAKWIAIMLYVVVAEVIKRWRKADINRDALTELEVKNAVIEENDKCDKRLSAYKEIRRFYINKFKAYKRTIEVDIGNGEKLLECMLKLENKLDIHILENHYTDLSMGELENYIDYIIGEFEEIILSKFDSLDLFKTSELKIMVATIIHTSINIKKRLQK